MYSRNYSYYDDFSRIRIFVINDAEKNPRSPYYYLCKSLKRGRESAISEQILADLLNLSVEDLNSLVTEAMIEGNAIASCQDGYYIPGTVQEMFWLLNKESGKLHEIMRRHYGEQSDQHNDKE